MQLAHVSFGGPLQQWALPGDCHTWDDLLASLPCAGQWLCHRNAATIGTPGRSPYTANVRLKEPGMNFQRGREQDVPEINLIP